MTSILASPVRLYRYAIVDTLQILKRHGVRELLRRRGWKFVASVFAYYVVRDSLLYIVPPLCIPRGSRLF